MAVGVHEARQERGPLEVVNLGLGTAVGEDGLFLPHQQDAAIHDRDGLGHAARLVDGHDVAKIDGVGGGLGPKRRDRAGGEALTSRAEESDAAERHPRGGGPRSPSNHLLSSSP